MYGTFSSSVDPVFQHGIFRGKNIRENMQIQILHDPLENCWHVEKIFCEKNADILRRCSWAKMLRLSRCQNFYRSNHLFYNEFIFHRTMIKHILGKLSLWFPNLFDFWKIQKETPRCFQSGPCFNASPHISRAVTCDWWRMKEQIQSKITHFPRNPSKYVN